MLQILVLEIPAASISAALMARAELLFCFLCYSSEASRSIAGRSTPDGLGGDVFMCSSTAVSLLQKSLKS